jgi:two-component system nitrate/nitrite response regulator NarL
MVKAQLFLIDDQELILEAISGLIKFRGMEQGILVAGVAQSYEQALIALEQLQPDLVLLDMYMPSVNGHEVAFVLRQKWPEIKILMLSNHEGRTDIAQAKAAGANGYAFKSGSHQALIDAIMAVLKGDQDFVVPNQFEGLASLDEPPYMRLTHRQRQVLKLLAHGENNKSIAKLLKISIRTVEKHREEVIGKLNNPSPIELVEFSQKLGLPLNPPAL